MKRTLIIGASIAVVILLIIRMVFVISGRQDKKREQFVSKLNYNFSARVDSVALFNPRAPVGMIYITPFSDTLVNKEKRIARSMGPEFRGARFFDVYRKSRFSMFSKDAKLYTVGDSLYVNTSDNKMILFHESKLVREFTISEEIRF